MFEFMDNQNYDMGLKKNQEAVFCVDQKKGKYVKKVMRPIDQKCTADVLVCVAAGIIDFTKEDFDKHFCVNDIWKSDFSSNYVTRYFKKPDPKTEIENEYDKFFSMPINTFLYAGIIKFEGTKKGKGNKYYFKVIERQALVDISYNKENAYEFLVKFLNKLVVDSKINKEIEDFFNKQDEISYKKMRETFYEYFKNKTNIEKEKEKGRIFSKVINVLALDKSKKGTYRGHISKKPIDFTEIYYNRENWRFENTTKSKGISRKEFLDSVKKEQLLLMELNLDYSDTAMARTKSRLRSYNEKFRNGKSEVEKYNDNLHESEAHHMFPQHEKEYKCIRACAENLVLLTSTQHDYYAHDKDKRYINKEYQFNCLIEKLSRIEEYFKNEDGDLYDFERLKLVLNIGFKTKEFSDVPNGDYDALRKIINKFKNQE